MRMRERLRKGKAEQERRAHLAARRAEEVWSASSLKMRKAERAPREAVYRAEMLKCTIEGGGLRPRWPRSLEAVREGSGTGEPPQHQAAHHRIDHGLATLAQPLVVLAQAPALREPTNGSFRHPAPW